MRARTNADNARYLHTRLMFSEKSWRHCVRQAPPANTTPLSPGQVQSQIRANVFSIHNLEPITLFTNALWSILTRILQCDAQTCRTLRLRRQHVLSGAADDPQSFSQVTIKNILNDVAAFTLRFAVAAKNTLYCRRLRNYINNSIRKGIGKQVDINGKKGRNETGHNRTEREAGPATSSSWAFSSLHRLPQNLGP